MAARSDERADGVDRSRQNGGGFEVSGFQANFPARDPRDVEQVIDESHKMMKLAFDHVAGPVAVVAGEASQAKDLKAGAEGRKRIAELVREHGDELILAAVGIPQDVFRPLQVGDVGENAE